MSLNIIDLIKGQLGPALISQTAAQLGENESGISKAIGGLLPAVIGGLANNPNSPTVLDVISNAPASGILGNLSDSTSGNTAVANVLPEIFGDRINNVATSIATYAGVSSNSASALLNLVTKAAIGSIGRYAAENNLDRNGISTLLSDQKDVVSTLLPAGVTLASLNVGDWAKGYKFDDKKPSFTRHDEPKIEVTRSVADGGTFPDRNTAADNKDGSVWKWLLPLLLLLAAGYFLWDQCSKKETTTTTTATDSTMVTGNSDTMSADSQTTTVTTTKADEDIDLNGTPLKGYRDGMEDRMITFLKSDGYKNAADDEALKNQWYDFDHVNFKMASASELEAGSEGQLDNLAAILKAYPDAKIKIGGYTDKVGNETDNIKLSTQRAVFIKNWLAKNGVTNQVLDAEGYGSEFATVDASASDAERAVDRKMSVRFAK